MYKQASSSAFTTVLLASAGVLAALAMGAFGAAGPATDSAAPKVATTVDVGSSVRLATLPLVTVTGRRATTLAVVEWPTVTVIAHRRTAIDDSVARSRDDRVTVDGWLASAI